MPQVPQVSSVASIDIRPPVSNAPRSDGDAFSQLLQAGNNNEPAPAETRGRDNGPNEARSSERPERSNRRDDSSRTEQNSDTQSPEQTDQTSAKDASKEPSKDKDGSSSGSDDKPKDQASKDDDSSAADAAAPAPAEIAANANIQAVTAAVVAAPASVEPANTATAPNAGQKIEAAAAPQPQMPQAAQTPTPEAAKGEIDAAAQAALNTGKPVADVKKDSAPQIPQAAADEPQQPTSEKPAQAAKPATVDVSTLSAPKLFQNMQPQGDKPPVMQDQNAAPANVAAAAVKPEAKPDAGNAAPEHETLESVLSKHFAGDIHVSNNAQIVLPDPTRSLQSNPAPMSVSLQTSASAANNQPVPLQAAALAIEIASRAKDGSRQFDIRLDPPELGRIDVKLDVDKSGQVNTHLTVDRPETLDLLRRDSQGLERALQQAGLKTSDGALEFSLRQQTPDSPFNQRNQAQANPQGNAPAGADIEQTAVVHAEQYQWAARLRGGVDIRV